MIAAQEAHSIKLLPIGSKELLEAKLHPREVVKNYLYADVRIRIAAGGTGKTTLALYEAMRLALGKDLWGRNPDRESRTVIVTREDTKEILVARLREVIKSEYLTEDETKKVLNNVSIIDLTGNPFRLSLVAGDMVMPDSYAIDELVEVLDRFKPDWLIFDPLVSFGVGESRVNDAEQGLIEAFRILRNRLDCCVEGIHHTGKQNARNKTDDQYSGRGGSALADGSRMVAVLNPLNANEWAQETGLVLEPNSAGLVMALPKLSYSPKQESVFIKRTGYKFEMVTLNRRTPEQELNAIVEQVYQFLIHEYSQNRHYSKADLDAKSDVLSLSRKQIRSAASELIVSGRVIYHEVKGKSGSHYEPLKAATLGDTLKAGGEK